jgi:tetracycline repressor-like protein
MRQLQRDEGELAFWLLTLAPYGFHPRFVTLVRALLAEDVAEGRLDTPVPLEDLAYTAVRIVESSVHRAAITGDEPDAGQ